MERSIKHIYVDKYSLAGASKTGNTCTIETCILQWCHFLSPYFYWKSSGNFTLEAFSLCCLYSFWGQIGLTDAYSWLDIHTCIQLCLHSWKGTWLLIQVVYKDMLKSYRCSPQQKILCYLYLQHVLMF